MQNKTDFIEIKPYFREKIWGGSRLKQFNLEIPSNNTGEAWLISAVKGCESFVPAYGMNLRELWEKNIDNIFGNNRENVFPLLSKILDANDNLSIQVHPNDELALKKHNSLGKAESWYFLEKPVDNFIYYGHNAKNEKVFWEMLESKKWNQFLKTEKVSLNDFVYVPPGKVHSLTKGSMALEIQQTSDITYRLYDFNRKDDNGNFRDLHLEDSAKSISYPDSNLKIINKENGNLIDNNFFTIDVITSNNQLKNYQIQKNKWIQFSVIEGAGTINNFKIFKGQSYIIPYSNQERILKIIGNVKIIFSYKK